MKELRYVITDEIGIHARPAGLLVKEAKEFESRITIEANDKSADATRIMSIMGLGVEKDTEIVVKAEGPDEVEAIIRMEEFLKENL